MRHSGYNPIRRNRKIGTEDSGWRNQSKFEIPKRWESWKDYYEKLHDYVAIKRWIHDLEITIVVEPCRKGFCYPCTPDDIAHMLGLLPADSINGARSRRGVVLRQSTKKQSKLCGVWGRMVYNADAGPVSGPAIFLEAEEANKQLRWPSKLSGSMQREFERMEQLSLRYSSDKRYRKICWNVQDLRRWLLYHTLIHEVGHWAEYLSKLVVPFENGEGEWQDLEGSYFQRPQSERESFAHRFSDEWRDELIRQSVIPFARRFDANALRKEGLDPEWFRASSPDLDEAGLLLKPTLTKRRHPLQIPKVKN